MPYIVTPDKIFRALAEDLTVMRPDNEKLVVMGVRNLARQIKGPAGWLVRWLLGRATRHGYSAGLRWLHKKCADHPITLED